jgi:uncharacterized membrane protein YfcA
MLSLPILAALALAAVATSFISGVLGMAGGMILIGLLLVVMPVPEAMVFHGVVQVASNVSRSWLWHRHIKWKAVLQFGIGAACALAVFSFLRLVPSKPIVLMLVGLMPFLALAVPQRAAPDIERRGQALLAGLVSGAVQLLAGVTGPLLDVFFVRTGLSRQANVATKAAAQVLGQLMKVAYFGLLVAHPGGRDGHQWAAMTLVVACAVLGTALSRRFLERMSDRQFYFWIRRIILVLGAIYIAEGLWHMVGR